MTAIMHNLPHQQHSTNHSCCTATRGPKQDSYFNRFLQVVGKQEVHNKQNTDNRSLNLLKELKTAGYHGSFFHKDQHFDGLHLKHKSNLTKADMLLQFGATNEQQTKQPQKKPTPTIPKQDNPHSSPQLLNSF